MSQYEFLDKKQYNELTEITTTEIEGWEIAFLRLLESLCCRSTLAEDWEIKSTEEMFCSGSTLWNFGPKNQDRT